MRIARIFFYMALAMGLASCGSKFKTYNGPEVTQVVVMKEERKLFLLHGNETLKQYKIDLGFEPKGPKQVEGDGKTPEGLYYIDRRNPNSEFHLSLGISYPNPQDVETAKGLGMSPGGDIFIHGQDPDSGRKGDWTAGCIAVRDKDMENIYAMVKDGTPIWLMP